MGNIPEQLYSVSQTLRHNHSSTGTLTENLPVCEVLEPVKGLSSGEDEADLNSGVSFHPIKGLIPRIVSL